MKRLGAMLVLLALVCLGFPGSPAAAIELKEWVEGLRVTPFLSQKVEYETNVNETSDNEKDSIVLRTIPGLLVDYTAGAHSLSVGYRAEIIEYLQESRLNTVEHFAVGQLRLDFPRLLFVLKDDFTVTSDPPGTELTGKIDSTTNVLSPQIEWRFTPRLSAGLTYSWTYVNYEKSVNELDRDEHLFDLSAYWKVAPRADISLGYTYGWSTFPNDSERDLKRHYLRAGVRGDLTAKLSSSLRAGAEFREPDKGQYVSFNSWVASGDVFYRATERTTFSLTLSRDAQESDFGSNQFYESTSATLGVGHSFSPKISVSARVGGGFNDYPSKETVDGKTDWRQDWFYGAGAGIDYNIQPWLRVGADYSLTGRDSNFGTFDFVNHRLSARVTLQF